MTNDWSSPVSALWDRVVESDDQHELYDKILLGFAIQRLDDIASVLTSLLKDDLDSKAVNTAALGLLLFNESEFNLKLSKIIIGKNSLSKTARYWANQYLSDNTQPRIDEIPIPNNTLELLVSITKIFTFGTKYSGRLVISNRHLVSSRPEYESISRFLFAINDCTTLMALLDGLPAERSALTFVLMEALCSLQHIPRNFQYAQISGLINELQDDDYLSLSVANALRRHHLYDLALIAYKKTSMTSYHYPMALGGVAFCEHKMGNYSASLRAAMNARRLGYDDTTVTWAGFWSAFRTLQWRVAVTFLWK